MTVTNTLNIIMSTMLWELCNQIICFSNKIGQYNSRSIGNIHAIIIFLYSFIYCYIYDFDVIYNNLINGISRDI